MTSVSPGDHQISGSPPVGFPLGLYETIPPREDEAPRLPTPDLAGFSPLHVFWPPQLNGQLLQSGVTTIHFL